MFYLISISPLLAVLTESTESWNRLNRWNHLLGRFRRVHLPFEPREGRVKPKTIARCIPISRQMMRSCRELIPTTPVQRSKARRRKIETGPNVEGTTKDASATTRVQHRRSVGKAGYAVSSCRSLEWTAVCSPDFSVQQLLDTTTTVHRGSGSFGDALFTLGVSLMCTIWAFARCDWLPSSLVRQ